MLTSSETCVTVEIADLIISEGMSLNIYRKHLFKEFLDLESNVSKSYNPPNSKLISKDLLGVIHYYNMKSNLIIIKK